MHFAPALPSTDPTRLYRYREGLCAVDLLTAAIVEFDLFTWLADQPSTDEEICRRFDLHARPVDVLLTLSAANGLIVRDGVIRRVTDLGREHLTAASPWHLGPYFASLAERQMVQDFIAILRTGRPANWGGQKRGLDWHRAMETDAFARRFTAAMDCRGRLLAPALVARVALAGRGRLLDVGGGSGIYARTFASAHPHLTATVFEQAPVDRLAASDLVSHGASDRVGVHTGDFLRDPWPLGYDVHLLSNVLHDWDVPELRAILAASWTALEPGGMIVIHDAFIDAAKSGPLPVAEYSALLAHATQGKCYSIREYEDELTAAGFDRATFQPTVVDRGVMTARKPTASGPPQSS